MNSQGTTLAAQENVYDPHGDLLFRKDHVYVNGGFVSTQTTAYSYTPDHRVATLTRAFGSSLPRCTSYTYLPSGKLASKTLPDGITLRYTYNPLGCLSRLDSSDSRIHHSFIYNRLGELLSASDENQNIVITRELDSFGNVTLEKFPTLTVRKTYDHFNRITSLLMDKAGEVHYTYDPLYIRLLTRVSPVGDLLYIHRLEVYDLDGNLTTESLLGGLGTIQHTTDSRSQPFSISSSYFSQTCHYDEVGNLLTDQISNYTYDDLSQLTSEPSHVYSYDSLYNRLQKNDQIIPHNSLNELLSPPYDVRGNPTAKGDFHYAYDPLDRLIEATSATQKITFTYDPLGRRLSKTVYTATDYGWKKSIQEDYLYNGQNEIGAFVKNRPQNLCLLASQKPVAIELDGQIFAPILDVQGNVRHLIDPASQSKAYSYDFTAFGEPLQTYNDLNPWRYASKRFDAELGLIYFGKRYYDPSLGRWLTTDPAGFIDSTNLYQYVFNNPFRYRDPDGSFAFAIPLLIWGAELVLPTLTAMAVPVFYAAVAGTIAYGGYKAVQALNAYDHNEYSFEYYPICERDLGKSIEMQRKKKGDIDETLSDDPFNDANLEDVTHPVGGERGHYKFKDKRTGKIIEYDKGKPGYPGHKGHDHYHRPNPDRTGYDDWYLDSKGNAVPNRSEPSHLYPPAWVWWD